MENYAIFCIRHKMQMGIPVAMPIMHVQCAAKHAEEVAVKILDLSEPLCNDLIASAKEFVKCWDKWLDTQHVGYTLEQRIDAAQKFYSTLNLGEKLINTAGTYIQLQP